MHGFVAIGLAVFKTKINTLSGKYNYTHGTCLHSKCLVYWPNLYNMSLLVIVVWFVDDHYKNKHKRIVDIAYAFLPRVLLTSK